MSRTLLAARLRTTLYLEQRPEGPVVLKVLAPGASVDDEQRLDNDLSMSRDFVKSCLRRGLGRTTVDGRPALILEYVDGNALSARVVTNPTEVLEVLEIGVLLARALAELHALRIVHRDVKPSNVVYHASTHELALIDFGLAARLHPSLGALPPSTELEGTLAYLAPEQSGRTGQSVDERADLYAFGATLYELFAGRPPFEVTDPAQIVHAHLARTPVPIHLENPAVPETVSKIVARLLAKSPEDRYQTAIGVAADLERCLRGLNASGSLEPFALNADVAGRFELPARLYGRAEVLEALAAAFDSISDGGRALVLVEGKPGVGKTAVVRHGHAAIAARGGVYAEGRFDAHRRDVPYAALSAAFGGLVRELFSLGDAELAATQARLSNRLGQAAGALEPLVPGLERLIPVEPAVELGAGEAKTRLLYLARGFLAAISKTRPVVLFLDDLQWADRATLDLLEAILTDPTPGRLLVIAGVRTGDSDAEVVLRERLADLRAGGVPLESLSIGPLGEAHVRELLSDALHANTDELGRLADLVFARTRGNAFFVRRLLSLLHARGAVAWDEGACRWRFDEAAVLGTEIGDDVAALLGAELSGLAPDVQRLVALAAALGSEVELRTLSSASNQPVAGLRRGLGPAIRSGLLVPLGLPAAWTEERLDERLERSLSVRFAHEHVREAAYQLISSEERPALLLELGLLLARDDEQRRARLFDIANLLARGAGAVKPEQRRQVAQLLVEAGVRALSSAAQAQSASLLAAALELLGDDALDTEPELALTATIARGEAEYHQGHLDRAEALALRALSHARSPTERFTPIETRILVAIERNDMRRAIEIGLEALDELGVKIARDPQLSRVIVNLLKLRLRLLGKRPAELASLPEMTDEGARVAMRILQRTVPAAFRAGSKVFPLLVFRMVELSLRFGNSSVSAFAWGGYAITLSGVLGAYDAGHAYGQLALSLADRFQDPRQTPGALFVWANFLRHWKEPLAKSLEPLRDAFRIGMESGDQFTAVWAASYRAVWMHALGVPLPEVAAELNRIAELASRDRGASILHCTLRQVVACFRGNAADPSRLNGEFVDEVVLDEQLATDAEATQVFIVHYYKLLLASQFGDPAQAVMLAEAAEQKLEAVTGLPWIVFFTFYSALARLALERKSGERDSKIDAALKRFRRFTEHDSDGKRDRLLLLEAELERTRGSRERARSLYDQAVEAARASGRRDVEALGLELAAESLTDEKALVVAEAYRERAAQAYRALGADAKAERLAPLLPAAVSDTITGTPSSSPAVDVASVLKASAALSAEIVVPRLLSRMMSILVENAGAERGVLVLLRDETLLVEAEQTAKGEVRLGASTPLSQATGLVQAVIRRVARSGIAEVIEDAQAEPALGASPHVTNAGVRSILCVPIKHQGKLTGVLYLENNLARAAFTPARVELLSLLATQAAIALENARLYEQQVALTNAHRRFVPHEFLESLGRRGIGEVELGDSVQKEMSILFSDIRGFTTHVEGMTPEENIGFINAYLRAMEPMIVSAGGFVEGYIGDAILALFDRGAESALTAALAMLRALEPLNRERVRESKLPIRIGIGINTGPLTLGTIGGPNRIKCGVIGDSVNVAARIESLTRTYGVSLVVSGETLARVSRPSDYRARLVDTVRVVGRHSAVVLHELYDADSEPVRDAKDAATDRWKRARELYCEGAFTDAERAFADYAEKVPGDPVAALYRERCAQFGRRRPLEWDGVTSLEHK
jgi:predicted ATPase/class 3 adenylate cyclase